MSTLKAILFDMDDTLIDWSKFDGQFHQLELNRFQSVCNYLVGLGHTPPTPTWLVEQLPQRAERSWKMGHETLISPHLAHLIMDLFFEAGIPKTALDVPTLVEHYGWDAAPGVMPFEDVPPVLDLFVQHGIQLGIVTNAFQTASMRLRELETQSLLHYFPDCVITAADIGRLKPHPSIFQAALSALNAQPDETVFVGDNLVADVLGSQRMGMKGVWRKVAHHQYAQATQDSIMPDATITDFSQLLPHLDAWFPAWR
ncbi:MAG: HAD family hydrolase [Phototrophicaceae bacterium]